VVAQRWNSGQAQGHCPYEKSLDLLQKSIFSCRGEVFAPGFIGKIRVFIRKCFALIGFMQEVYCFDDY
jgi:hypothetical protein